LQLRATAITDEGISHLRGTKLTSLGLEIVALTDKGLEHLEHIKSLENVMLARNAKFTSAGVDRLRKALPTLKVQFTRANDVA
jgi:hypothetical protein